MVKTRGRLTQGVFEDMREFGLSEGNVVPAAVCQGQDGLLQEGQGLVDVRGFFERLTLGLEERVGDMKLNENSRWKTIQTDLTEQFDFHYLCRFNPNSPRSFPAAQTRLDPPDSAWRWCIWLRIKSSSETDQGRHI